jgi:hypothetical protein
MGNDVGAVGRGRGGRFNEATERERERERAAVGSGRASGAQASARSERAAASAAGYADLSAGGAGRSGARAGAGPRGDGGAGHPPSVQAAARTAAPSGKAELDRLTVDVLRLRAELARTTNPKARGELSARIGRLSAAWCDGARAAGLKPPPDSFDPFRASDEDLKNALLWTEVGNTFPLGAFSHPTDPNRFRDDILAAWAVRVPGVLDRVIAANPNDPRLVPMLEASLRRLGDPSGCEPGETVQSLVKRRADRLAARSLAAADEASKRITIGLDGRIGTAEAIDGYETVQYILAMNPGTTTGSLLASAAAWRGGDIDDMRHCGELGTELEGIADITARKLPHERPHW